MIGEFLKHVGLLNRGMVSTRKYQKIAEAKNFSICKSKLTGSLTEIKISCRYILELITKVENNFL